MLIFHPSLPGLTPDLTCTRDLGVTTPTGCPDSFCFNVQKLTQIYANLNNTKNDSLIREAFKWVGVESWSGMEWSGF